MNGMQNLAYDGADEGDKNVLTHRKVAQNNSDQQNLEIELSPIDTNIESIENEEDNPKRSKMVRIIKVLALNVAFFTYFGFATSYYINNRCKTISCDLAFCDNYGMLLFLVGVTYIGLIYYKIVKPYLGEIIYRGALKPFGKFLMKIFNNLAGKIGLGAVIIAGLAGYIYYETREDLQRLRALIGIAVMVLIGYAFSNNPKKIRWRPVICGILLQFCLGVFCIRWTVGREIFTCFGNKIAEFLGYSMEGAEFVFGNFLVNVERVFVFTALPTIFFFSLCISVLYYIGAMQWFLFFLGSILQSILGTTVCESVTAAANIFLGMSESPLIIKPYLKSLTKSELHSIMTSGFATVSGTVFAAYISFGADPANLITASVMAAPATLFYSKLFYPETEKSLTTSDNIVMAKSEDSSLLDAASNGANQGINLILGIVANLVAFVAFVAFADAMVQYFTVMLGFEDVGLQFLLGKLFIPLAWALGVDWVDCEKVGNVIGTKTIVNEFVAFKLLGEYKDANAISLRSAAIATYAICGFANPSSLGIMIGALSALAPERRPDITSVALRSFLCGCFVCFITAGMAGLLMTDEMVTGTLHDSKMSNMTLMFV